MSSYKLQCEISGFEIAIYVAALPLCFHNNANTRVIVNVECVYDIYICMYICSWS